MNGLSKNFILGVGVTNETRENILEYIVKTVEKKDQQYYIVTPNPEIIVFANKDTEFKKVLNQAKIALCDGVGLFFAGKLLGKPFVQRITGVDLVEALCKQVAKKPITVGFLGARPGIAERVADCLQEKYPGLRVVFTGAEWPDEAGLAAGPVGISPRPMSSVDKLSHNGTSFSEAAPAGTRRGPQIPPPALSNALHSLAAPLQSSSEPASPTSSFSNSHLQNTKYKIPDTIDILFVAFGFPKQEQWMSRHLEDSSFRVAVGVGGVFDYIAGVVPRAPTWVSNLGFEWLFRLLRQPWRIKRQLSLLVFLMLVFREKIYQLTPIKSGVDKIIGML